MSPNNKTIKSIEANLLGSAVALSPIVAPTGKKEAFFPAAFFGYFLCRQRK